MFTGLIEDLGAVLDVRPDRGGQVMRIRTRIPLAAEAIGASIAVDGVCLTLETKADDVFTATAARETLALTTLGGLRAGAKVHLERALALGDRLGGHLVQGHVDCVGKVSEARQVGESFVLWVEVPADHARYVAAKGSICIDGVSLTVNEIVDRRFRCNLVPHTTQVTKLGALRPGDAVNLEVDVLAKYVERLLLGREEGMGLTLDSLRRNGFA